MKIIFFDHDKEKIENYREILKVINEKEKQKKNFFSFHSNKELELDFINSELNELFELNKIDIIVSPANSYGHMTGGIDTDICKLDHTIQNKVYAKIHQSFYKDMDNEPYIPVGVCEPVKINNNLSIFIAPTMKHPKDVSNTNNTFLAFNSILIYLQSLFYHYPNLIIACPCLGTGIGNMDSKKSAKQILYTFLVHQII